MNQRQQREYAKLRMDGHRAIAALRIVRAPDYSDFLQGFTSANTRGEELERHEREFGRFLIRVTFHIDDAADLSWLGEFRRGEQDRRPDPDAVWSGDTRLGWFLPAQTEREQFDGLRMLKHGRREARELAREYVRQDCDRLRRYASGDLASYGVSVAILLGREVVVHDSLWGIDTDGKEYLCECAAEMLGALIRDLRESAARRAGTLLAAAVTAPETFEARP